MVVFSCSHCGESVQKPKVEKHYMTKCRNRHPNLSCMDCFKDFLGQDYQSHTKCITEEERYSGKGFQAKEKKGEKKQTAWVEMVQSVIDEQKNAPRNILRILENVGKHTNTPRKKPKFVNFVKNVCGHKTNPSDIDQAWDMISVKLAALSTNNQNNRNQNAKQDSGDKEDKEKENSSEKDDTITSNGKAEEDSNDVAENVESEEQNNEDKKLTKKQRKEEKKRRKYEAELESNSAPPPAEEEEEEVEKTTKKGKKKNRSESINEDEEPPQEKGKNKNKKRKRQDTVNSVQDLQENGVSENSAPAKEKTVKKKLKVGKSEDAEESICLHDQNVAKIEELSMKDKFDWHSVIMSVLQKKGEEVQFKRLQKKVLAEYAEATGCDVDDRIVDKFIKKLRSAPNVRVDKNRVILVQ